MEYFFAIALHKHCRCLSESPHVHINAESLEPGREHVLAITAKDVSRFAFARSARQHEAHRVLLALITIPWAGVFGICMQIPTTHTKHGKKPLASSLHAPQSPAPSQSGPQLLCVFALDYVKWTNYSHPFSIWSTLDSKCRLSDNLKVIILH